MPAADQKSGSCYIWIITASLFICIAAGGALLAVYMNQPDASSWYPIAGIFLVCLPWLFWFLTFLYRLLSRRFGFRMVCWGAPDSLPRTSTKNGAMAGSSKIADGGEDNNHRDEVGMRTTALESGNTGGSPTTTEGSQAPLRYSMAS